MKRLSKPVKWNLISNGLLHQVKLARVNQSPSRARRVEIGGKLAEHRPVVASHVPPMWPRQDSQWACVADLSNCRSIPPASVICDDALSALTRDAAFPSSLAAVS